MNKKDRRRELLEEEQKIWTVIEKRYDELDESKKQRLFEALKLRAPYLMSVPSFYLQSSDFWVKEWLKMFLRSLYELHDLL